AFGVCVAAVSLVAVAQMTSHISQAEGSNTQEAITLMEAGKVHPGDQIAVAPSLGWMLMVPQAFEVSWTDLEQFKPGRQPLPAGTTVVETGWPAGQPAPLAGLVQSAKEFGVRVHLIRRPGRRRAGDVRSVFLGWTAGDTPWLLFAEVSASAPELTERDLKELAAGIMPSFGVGWDDPLYLVCTHGKRNVCCARLGSPLAQALAARHPGPVWETTHVGGHRFAANLVLLPHGLYYGPVTVALAAAAIDAYQRGSVVVDRYRGRAGQPQAGQPQAEQEAEYARLAEGRALSLGLTACGLS
ncbi:MAG TPA: sucrase ferredoxin, partial [Streptosporangiaceae bacterium]|nr:sucrase ferredoxin [Streptosporangiaceae bacterium]